jgi:hypothetical protein
MLRTIRLLNSLEAGTTTGANLQTILSETGRLGEFVTLLNLRSQTKRLASSPTAMNAVAASATAMNSVAASATAMNSVAASTTAMAAVGASSTATSAVLGSATANPILFNGTAGVGAFLNECRKRDGLSSDATLAGLATLSSVAASATAMNSVAASATAMNSVAASATAVSAVASSATALSAMNASDTAMNALYASALTTKVNGGGNGGYWYATVHRNGIGLFVRFTTKGNQAGWNEGATGNESVSYDGNAVSFSARSANPYNHTLASASPRLPMRRFASTLRADGYNFYEIAFIPLSA